MPCTLVMCLKWKSLEIDMNLLCSSFIEFSMWLCGIKLFQPHGRSFEGSCMFNDVWDSFFFFLFCRIW